LDNFSVVGNFQLNIRFAVASPNLAQIISAIYDISAMGPKFLTAIVIFQLISKLDLAVANAWKRPKRR
jgi:hypothetical protein